MQVPIYSVEGKETGTIELPEEIFNQRINEYVVHQFVVTYLSNQRQGTKNTKTRSEVRGGGIKPWKQKGTGRARQGSIRSPQWKGGGVAIGPKARDYSLKINKRLKKIALHSALTSKLQSGDLLILENFEMPDYSTAWMSSLLRNLSISNKTTMILGSPDQIIFYSSRNLQNLRVSFVGEMNAFQILDSVKCILTRSAVERLTEVYTNVSVQGN